MYKKYKKIKGMLILPMALLLISAFSAPALASNPSQLVVKVNTSSKVVALTFDDGDDGANIPAILQILKDNNIKGTFFVTGKAAESHPSFIKNIFDAGNLIGNHSYSHPYFSQLTYAQMQDELNKAETAIKNITGQSTKPYFRPPYGDYNSAVLQALGDAGYSKSIYWTIDTLDWEGVSTAAITQKVLDNISPGSIFLMHAGSGALNTKYALPGIISNLKAQGYQFVTISQLLTYSSTGSQYTVKSGDTLNKIAAAYGVTVQALVSANNIANRI
jgi:peptidoglycan/xylan/chitin deacetylase (PgdA/CDA1 family)